MSEDIKILEALLIHAENTLLDEEAIALEHLIKAYKEIEEENETLNERNQYLVKYRAKLEKELYESNENYIPVSLVEETIEELKEIADEDNKEEYIKIEVLQELLEKRK